MKGDKMPVDPVLPHDLDDLYGPGAEDADTQAETDLRAAAPMLYAALNDLLDLYISTTEATDTYCEVCETHAHKYIDKRGEWTGRVAPIKHKGDCIVGRAIIAIARADGEVVEYAND
jgi:hypothetical protein